MDSELKTKWVEALRSGKFKQIRGNLYEKDGNCCLGVLCVVSGMPNDNRLNDVHYTDELTNGLLGGFPSDTLWQLNDRDRKPFPEIADFIEKHL